MKFCILDCENMVQAWKQKARGLRREIWALYLAYRDPRMPIFAKVLVIIVVGYALSPIDLIPDMIPVLGQLDDLILLPLGIALVLHLIPADVMADCRLRAELELADNRPVSRVAGVVILALWIVAIAVLIRVLLR